MIEQVYRFDLRKSTHKGSYLVANIAEILLAACAFARNQVDYPRELDLHLLEGALSCRLIPEEDRVEHPAVNPTGDRKRCSHAVLFEGNQHSILVFFFPYDGTLL